MAAESFEEMARRERDDSNARRAEAAERKAEVARQVEEDRATAIDHLTRYLRPILEEAQVALNKTNVSTAIIQSWPDADPSFHPRMGFKIGGRPPIYFVAPGRVLYVEDTPSTKQAIRLEEQRALVEHAVSTALKEYYRATEKQ